MDALLAQASRRLIDMTEADLGLMFERFAEQLRSPATNTTGKPLGVAEAAERLGMSVRHLRYEIRLRRIAIVRARRGARIRICEAEIERYLKANTQPAIEPTTAPRKRKAVR